MILCLRKRPLGMRSIALQLMMALYAAAPAWAQRPGEANASPVARTVHFRVGDSDRRAIVVNAPAAGTRRPTVIVLHGGMGNADDMRARTGFDPLARTHEFMAVYAEGTEFRNGWHAWNTGYLLRRQVKGADDIRYLDALIDRLIADHGADPARIYMTGGSNGGMMTFAYAAERPERLAAAAPVVASMFSFDASPKVPLPMLIINGAKDEEVPLAGGMSGNPLVRGAQAEPFKPVREVVDFWVKSNRSAPEARIVTEGSLTTSTYDAGTDGAVTEFVLDSEGGHGWPGSRARRQGNSPISAFRGAERVWAFFADKSRTQPPDAPAPAGPVRAIDFAELKDPTRRDMTLGTGASGRAVPITVHVPDGTGPFPVVVISHGAGGDRDTHVGQARHLASHGYAVLCIEHVGSNREYLKRHGLRMMKTIDAMTRDSHEVLTRPRDVTFAIDKAEEWNRTHETLRGRLDLGRIGVVGHSFGAYTAMAICGMRPALDWLTPRIEPGSGIGPDLRDDRVTCGVAFSPQGAGEPFFITESFSSLRVPLLGITGSRDEQQAGRPAEGRKEAFALWPGGDHTFIWIGNAGHSDFTSASGTTGRPLPSKTREDVQPIVRAATLAFLDLHLKGDAAAAARLTASGLNPYLRGSVDRVDVLVK